MIQQKEPRLLPPSNYLTVSPNPTKDIWTIAVYDQRVETLSIEVLDMLGRCLYKQLHSGINMSDINVPAASLTAGTYLLRTVTNIKTETFRVDKSDK